MTSYYTTLGKLVKCPQYDKEITLSAKYRFTGNPNDEYEVLFSRATCPILENSKLHKDDQCDEYKYLECLTPHYPLLKDFPQIWDSRKTL